MRALRKLFDGWLAWAAAEDRIGGCPLLEAAIELDDQPGELRNYLVAQQKAWLDCIAQITANAVAEADLRRDLDVEQFAFQLNSVGLGFNFSYRLLDDKHAARRAQQAFRQLLAEAAR